MTTGKVEYAPDRKSRFDLAMDDGQRITESIIANIAKSKLNAEHQRLQSAVVEAAKGYRIKVREHNEYASEIIARNDPGRNEDNDPKWEAQLGAQCSAEYALSNAVDALIAFEAEHGIGEQ